MNGVMELTPEQMSQFRGRPIHELAAATATETPSIRGAAFTNTQYGLLPNIYSQELVDAAKKEFFFTNFINEYTLPPNASSMSVPKRNIFLGNSGFTWNTAGSDTGGSSTGTGPYANTRADISFTTFNNLSSVDARPLPHANGIALSRFDLRTNLLDLVSEAKNDIGYAMGERIDVTIAQQFGSSDGLTFAQSGTRGAIQLYGGDATADSGLTVGDVLTTDLIADGIRYLKGTENWYRDGGSGLSGTLTLDTTVLKNPWRNSADDPFVFFIGVAQEATLRKDSQFVNAAEYGSDTVVQNGEIGKYLETRIVVTTNVESFAASATGPDNTTVAAGLSGGMTRCILMKGKKAAAIVWGLRPEIRVGDWMISDQVLIAGWAYYAIVVVHSDAVVAIDVSNT